MIKSKIQAMICIGITLASSDIFSMQQHTKKNLSCRYSAEAQKQIIQHKSEQTMEMQKLEPSKEFITFLNDIVYCRKNMALCDYIDESVIHAKAIFEKKCRDLNCKSASDEELIETAAMMSVVLDFLGDDVLKAKPENEIFNCIKKRNQSTDFNEKLTTFFGRLIGNTRHSNHVFVSFMGKIID